MTRILGGVALFLAVSLGLSVWYGKTMTESATKYRTENVQLVRSIADQVGEIVKLRNIAAETESLLEDLRKANIAAETKSRIWERRYTNAIKNDPAAAEWADTPIPEPILDLLRDDSDNEGDNESDAASTSTSNGAKAQVYRGYDRGPTTIHQRTKGLGYTLL